MQSKTLTKALKVEQVEKMIQHFETYNFIKTNNTKSIQLGFLSENLKEFVRKEWLLSNVVSSEQPAFFFKSLTTREMLKTALADLRSLVNTVPFNLVEIDNSSSAKEVTSGPEPTNAVDLVRNQFKNKMGTIMRNLTFCSNQNAVEIFYQKQREHKTWWRRGETCKELTKTQIFKFSASPGRFSISNASTKEKDKAVSTEIQAEFPWGSETVEIIKYLPDFCAGDKDLEVNTSKRKKSTPHVVLSEIVLENAAFTFLCDSYERLNGDQRDVLRLNRKLAPFKVSIAGSGTSADEVKSLEEVSLLLAKQVRKLGFPVLFLPDAHSLSVERQVLRNDAMGVPYTLLLNEKTLKDGAIALRSRDTTLREQSHVSIVGEYLGTILK